MKGNFIGNRLIMDKKTMDLQWQNDHQFMSVDFFSKTEFSYMFLYFFFIITELSYLRNRNTFVPSS